MSQILIERGASVTEKDNSGDQPIHSAAKSGCRDLLDMLQKEGVEICTSGHQGNKVIHYACKFGRFELVQFLVKKGCPVGLRNNLKETPLHLAAAHYTQGNF